MDRFWSKINVGGPDECWNWTAWKDRDGYGRFRVGTARLGTRRQVLPTRFIMQWLGHNLTSCDLVCHHCDNPSCCNPRHLYVGTARDNIRDRDARGRSGSAKLTHDQVLDIYSAPVSTMNTELAELYGVRQNTICQIRLGRKWAWLTNPTSRPSPKILAR